MSHQNNYQSGQFADFSDDYPHQYPQHHNSYQQEVPNNNPSHPNKSVFNFAPNQQQQHFQTHQPPDQYGRNTHQPAYQETLPQQYTYQPFHQNFQQHPPQQPYSELAKPPQPYQNSQHYAVNQSHRQQVVPPPPLSVPPPLPPPPAIQPHQSQRDAQVQPPIPKPTDPRNLRSNTGTMENSSIPSNDSSSVSVVSIQSELSKKKKRQLKKQMRKEKKMTVVNKNLDSMLASFLQDFTMEEYRKIMHKLGIAIPVTDRCHAKTKSKAKGKICISFHCTGSCQNPCLKSESHRKLTTSERARFLEYLLEVKSRILEERSNQQEKKTKKKKTKKGVREGSANEEEEIYDINPNMETVLEEIAKESKLLEYHKRAKQLGVVIPRLDPGTDSAQGQICPAYHCNGQCIASCPNKESHRQLTAPEHKRLADYLLELKGAMIEERIKNPDQGRDEEGEEESTTSGKRKADSSRDDSSGSRATSKKQRLDLDNSDGRFDDCSDDDEVQILETLVATPLRMNDGTASNPVDLTDSRTPMTKELCNGLPSSGSRVDPNTAHSVVVSESNSLDLGQPLDTTTESVPTTEESTSVSVSTTNEGHGGEIPKLSLPESSSSVSDGVTTSDKEATMKLADAASIDPTTPRGQPRKEVLSPNSKSRKLKKLKAQLALAKKQHEVAKLKESLRKKDQELKEKRNQGPIRRSTLPPITALTTSLIIDNIHESGPEHMVYYPNSQDDYDLQVKRYKAMLYGDEEEKKETLSARKTQIEQDLAILKQRLESSLPTTAAAISVSKEDLQKKLEEAQANKDLSYWKLFVSKQEHILSGVDKQIQENAASLEECDSEMANVERDSKELLKSIKVSKVREATLAEMASKASIKILELRQRLHEEQAKEKG